MKPGEFLSVDLFQPRTTISKNASLWPTETINLREWLNDSEHQARALSKDNKFVIYLVSEKEIYYPEPSVRMYAIENPIGLPDRPSTMVQHFHLDGEVEDKDGNVYYVKDSYLHREDGPATTLFGINQYYLYGQKYSLEQYWFMIKDTEYAGRVFAEIFGNDKD